MSSLLRDIVSLSLFHCSYTSQGTNPTGPFQPWPTRVNHLYSACSWSQPTRLTQRQLLPSLFRLKRETSVCNTASVGLWRTEGKNTLLGACPVIKTQTESWTKFVLRYSLPIFKIQTSLQKRSNSSMIFFSSFKIIAMCHLSAAIIFLSPCIQISWEQFHVVEKMWWGIINTKYCEVTYILAYIKWKVSRLY